MKRQISIRHYLVLILLVSWSLSSGQTFEGWISYKMELLNPNPEIIPDSTWQAGMKQQLGERGYIVQKYYYKKEKYASAIDGGKEKGFQAYNPGEKIIYSWEENSDTAVTLESTKYSDEMIEIVETNELEIILGIPCNSIEVKSKSGEMTVWYNKEYLKMDADLYQGHKYGHWEQILSKIGCLPLKMEQKGFMTHVVQTATGYKEEPINDSRFAIPEFKVVIKNPIN